MRKIKSQQTPKPAYDVVLIGGGIMSTTLATLLHELDPTLKVAIFERLGRFAQESSAAWNNAGTGYSGFCELNHIGPNADGSVDISISEKVAEQFEVSKQFWAYLVQNQHISNPKDFISACPHLSLVFGETEAAILRRSFEKMTSSPLFEGMEFSDDHATLEKWIPLMMRKRHDKETIAATKMDLGTDVNFGALTRKMAEYLSEHSHVEIFHYHEARDLQSRSDGKWQMEIKDRLHQHTQRVSADFVFIGAGGYALPLLASADIPESQGYGGFPVAGEWLVSHHPELVEKHYAKVYTQVPLNVPPMSVPHLDLRIIDGKKALIFGPFASFSTKFLKEGSYLDLPESINFKNIRSLFGAWWHNLPLTNYLLRQVAMTKTQRMQHLREFIKDADEKDWDIKVAGQRVQIIKKDDEFGGTFERGTELVVSKNRRLACLLGSSGGASASAHNMLQVLEKCFPEKFDNEWRDKLHEMVPSYGQPLSKDAELTQKVRAYTKEQLELDY